MKSPQYFQPQPDKDSGLRWLPVTQIQVPVDSRARSGVTVALRHAFNDLRLHRLEANIQPANKASLALVQRLGFRYEGLSPAYLYIDGAWRDHERWSIAAPSPWTPDPSLPEV